MKSIDGNNIARMRLGELKDRVQALSFTPVFADVIVGDDPASLQYVRMKEKRARDIGADIHRIACPADTTTQQVIQAMHEALSDSNICGMIVQLPLPDHIDTQAVLDAVPVDIDIDVLNQESSEKFYNNESRLSFPAARASYELLQTVPHDRSGRVVVVGQGALVGKPVTHMLRNAGYHVDTITKNTVDKAVLLANADIVISGAGAPKLITGQDIKSGAILIDAGTSESAGGIVGDIDIDSVKDKASYISPVPGGVGPLTVALLLENVVIVAESRNV